MDTLTPVNTELMRQDASDMLVEYAASRLASFIRPYQLRRELEELVSKLRDGEEVRINEESFNELVQKATEFNTKQAGERPEKIAVKQIAWLQNLMSNDNVDIRSKLAANSQLTDLIGTGYKNRSELNDTQDAAALVRRVVAEMEDLVDQEESVYT